ncbi:MAG: heavy-metal-associated domain-containing protein [Bacteroidales bacterium]|nr:heavy-metal-associated domain-containing protein [Bacteroidales bacterium]
MNTKTLIITTLLLIIASFSYGQKQISTVEILTNPHCEACKKTIETELVYTKGIKDAELSMDTKIITIKYNESKISDKEIMKKIIDLGYTATIVHNKKNCKKERSCD